ncbi:MAG TPA: hypothetical protein DCF48_06150 [Rikenellaceae bacterium]|nr:hypothetical protein [Rikenellaceae bacterium]
MVLMVFLPALFVGGGEFFLWLPPKLGIFAVFAKFQVRLPPKLGIFAVFAKFQGMARAPKLNNR